MKHCIFVLFSAFLFFSCGNTDFGCDCVPFDFADDFCADDYSVGNSAEKIVLNKGWTFADFSKINRGAAFLYKAAKPRTEERTVVSVNAGHGTNGGSLVMTYSHPDQTPKITGGTNAMGAVESMAVSSGMTFCCGLSEAEVNRRGALILRSLLLENGFDVLMIRDSGDVQLDNIARTVISNNCADIHIAIHFDGDGQNGDKGVFYCGVPAGLCCLENVQKHRDDSERLGDAIVNGLNRQGLAIYDTGRVELDLTQTSYSSIPSVVIELGNQCTIPTTVNLKKRALGIMSGIQAYFGF